MTIENEEKKWFSSNRISWIILTKLFTKLAFVYKLALSIILALLINNSLFLSFFTISELALYTLLFPVYMISILITRQI